MTQYFVAYRPEDSHHWFPSVKTWAEIVPMIRKADEVGGQIRVYRIGDFDPQRLWIGRVNDSFWLEDMYGNHVEG